MGDYNTIWESRNEWRAVTGLAVRRSSIVRAGRGHARKKHVTIMCQNTTRLQAWVAGRAESVARCGEGAHSEQISRFTALSCPGSGKFITEKFPDSEAGQSRVMGRA